MIGIERVGDVTTIELQRSERRNALNTELVDALREAVEKAAADDVRAIVLTGAGTVFCAGADLSGDVFAADFPDKAIALNLAIDAVPVPVIAALNGITLAGGLELVLCCDLVLAARSTKIGDAHANFGLLPGGGGSVRLPRAIGPARAKYLLFTGDFVAASELVAAGLVNQVVDDEQLESATQAVADKIATKSPLGLRRMKALVDDGLQQSIDTALRLELLACEVHAHSADLHEGLAAFSEKRAPRFTGH
jgi:enoyl-CoA hydratase/carnithine racemase